jgi:hypothetical protein
VDAGAVDGTSGEKSKYYVDNFTLDENAEALERSPQLGKRLENVIGPN